MTAGMSLCLARRRTLVAGATRRAMPLGRNDGRVIVAAERHHPGQPSGNVIRTLAVPTAAST
jgi:hypothetical protein